MPSMYEIYERHADRYDELVDHEDWEGRLGRFLLSRFDFAGRRVIECGTGTGRVTALYIGQAIGALCLDRSAHMLARAQARLRDHAGKLEFRLRDNADLAGLGETADLLVEGWSFGHLIVDAEDVEATADALVRDSLGLLRPGGTAVLIETLGSGVDAPAAPDPRLDAFYGLLESRHGFARETVRTDYRFPDVAAAARAFGFFFGEPAGEAVRRRGSAVVPEFTGVWHRTLQ